MGPGSDASSTILRFGRFTSAIRRFTQRCALVEDSYGHGWQKDLATWIRDEAAQLIDAWRGEIDAVTTLADPLAFGVLERLLGQPVPELLPLVHRFSRYDERRYRRPSETPLECFQDAEREVWTLLRALVADRIASPRDDVPSRLLATGRLDYRDLMYTLRFVIQSTYQTSALAIAACVDIVARAGEQLRSLPLDATARAADEVLRVSSPVIRFARHVVTDTTLGDIPLRAGQRVVMFFPSANHDERVFEDPLRIDLARAENPHVAFGAGIHTCLGAPIARLHLTAVLDALRGLELQRVQPGRCYASSVNNGCDQVLVRRL